MCVFVCRSVTMITQNCVHLHQTGSVGEGSDHLQIKFWPSRAPGKGVCGRAKNFGSALLQPAHSVCISLSTFFVVQFFLQCVMSSDVRTSSDDAPSHFVMCRLSSECHVQVSASVPHRLNVTTLHWHSQVVLGPLCQYCHEWRSKGSETQLLRTRQICTLH